MSAPPVLVLGAGPTGLSAAYHLGASALLVERDATVGGLCRSIQSRGFTFDYAGHIMFSNDPYVHELYARLLGDNVHWQEREAWIHSHGVDTRYPFQGSLHGLPVEIVTECLMGAIQARYDDWRKPLIADREAAAARNGGARPHREARGPARVPRTVCSPGSDDAISDCCADGVPGAGDPLVTRAALARSGGEPRDFEEFIYRVWGAGIARHFAVPYNRKLWGVPLHEMETSWLGGRVPLPDLQEMVEGALSPTQKPMGPNARFGYPLRGGFQALMDGFVPHLRGPLRLGVALERLDPERRVATMSDGSTYRYETLVSTIPLPELVRAMGHAAPPEIRAAAEGLQRVSVRCVHLGIGRPHLTDKHWIYYPEDTIFHRIFVQGNASPLCNAPGGFGLTCEITYSERKPLPVDGDALIQRTLEDCRRVGIIGADDPVWTAFTVDLPYAYVVYDHGRAARVQRVRDWLERRGVLLAGRYSEWEYYNSDHAFLAGRHAAERAVAPRAVPDSAVEGITGSTER